MGLCSLTQVTGSAIALNQLMETLMLTEKKLRRLEEQIIEKKKTVDFDTREFTI
jgi:hypothetical protein